MKSFLVLLTLTTGLLFGCKGEEKSSPEAASSSQSEENLRVYVSNYPLYFFAERIGGAKIDLRYPMEVAANPATWTPDANTVSDMQGADLILLNGATYESWLMTVSLPDSLLADTSMGYATRLLPSGETFTHSHGEDGAHSHEGVAWATWLDLSLAVQQAEAVKKALIKRRPQERDFFETNFKELAESLSALDSEFKKITATDPSPTPAYSHPVYTYFQKAYGLTGPSLDWEPDSPLTHDMLHEVDHLKRAAGINTIVWERPPLEASIDQLAEKGIQSVVIQPLENTPDTGDFITHMRENLKALQTLYTASPAL
ncbi:metal ABC transporter substrate-binding protein [Robiginitalea sp.]|uniref:metal ABC transporter substrate-binding protein n=1 Tax=Robiginitalea sp. TaxID=1902411 RepID=UPI003C70C051